MSILGAITELTEEIEQLVDIRDSLLRLAESKKLAVPALERLGTRNARRTTSIQKGVGARKTITVPKGLDAKPDSDQKRQMSAASKKKISVAAKARWAKARKAKSAGK